MSADCYHCDDDDDGGDWPLVSAMQFNYILHVDGLGETKEVQNQALQLEHVQAVTAKILCTGAGLTTPTSSDRRQINLSVPQFPNL